MAMSKILYNGFKSAFPFIIKVQFSESEIYFDERLKPLIMNAILNFEKDYIRLSHKYELGMPFYSMESDINSHTYEKRYLEDTFNYMLIENKINFFVQCMKEGKASYAPLVSSIFYLDSEGNLKKDHIIDIDSFKVRCDKKESWLISQPPFDIFGEGYNQLIIDQSGTINELNFISLHFGLGSNIFYPFIHDPMTKEVIDNRIVAYQNAPRYNSLLREIKLLCKKYGFYIGLSEEGVLKERSPYETEDGILLDNKIVYQEDLGKGIINVPKINSF